MSPHISHELFDNVAILLALTLVYDVFILTLQWDKGANKVLSGLILGAMGVAVMLVPWEYAPGIFFDARSILLGIGAAFFGTVPVLIAMSMTIMMRVMVGGSGIYAGILGIIFASGLGLLFRYRFVKTDKDISGKQLYAFGFMNALSVLAITLLMKWPIGLEAVSKIWLPIMVIFPLGNLLLGKIMVSRLSRIKARMIIQDNEQRYRQMFKDNHAVKLIIDPSDGQIIEANEAASMYYGYSLEILASMNIAEINTMPANEIQARMEEAKAKSRTYFEFQHRLASGDIRDVEVYSGPVNYNGEEYLYSIIHDITFRKRQLRLQDARVRLIEFAAGSRTTKEVLIRVLDELEELTGSQIGFFHFINADQETINLQAWSTRTSETYSDTELDESHYPISKAGVWVESFHQKKSVIHNDYTAVASSEGLPEGHAKLDRELVAPVIRGDRVLALLGVGNKLENYLPQDVVLVEQLADLAWELVEQKRSEEALRESEDRFRGLFDNAPLSYQSLDEGGDFLAVNNTFCELLGYSPEEVIGKNFADFLNPDYRGVFAENFPKFKERGFVHGVEFKLETRDGTAIDIVLDGKIGHNPDGSFKQSHCVFQDVTKQKQVEERLSQQQNLLAKAQELGKMGTWELDIVNNILVWTDENCRIFGVEPGTVANVELFFKKVHPEDRDFVNAEWTAATRGKNYDIKHRLLVDGVTKWVREKADVTFDETGTAISAIGFTQDISDSMQAESEKKDLEQQLRQAQKMEAIGTMAGGIAHDFNNILQAQFLFSGIVENQLPDEPKLRENFQHIVAAGERARDLVARILTFSRHADGEYEDLKFQDVLKGTLKLLKASTPSNIKIEAQIEADAPAIRGDVGELEQIILNLCNNAIQAMAEKHGQLKISFGSLSASETSSLQTAAPAKQRFVELMISDTGSGMDAEIQKRIFDPFFTTKPPGEGTGLGLAVVFGAVKEMQGSIEVESEPGQGTTFRIILPVAEPVESGSLEVMDDLVQQIGGSILLIDDEDEILQSGKAILEQMGFEVITKRNGFEALKYILHESHTIGCVITDTTMPEMTGLELAKEIVDISPDIPIMLMGGNLTRENRAECDKLGINGILKKPWTLDELKAMLSMLVAEKR